MKLLGMLLVILCFTMTGTYLAMGLSKRVERLENSLSLLGLLYDRLRFLQPSMRQLTESLCQLEQFEKTVYLTTCRDAMRQGCYFPESWRIGIDKAVGELGKSHADILLPLGEVLGCTDLESQLAAINHAKALLENRLVEARSYREKHAKLYQSLGVLGGIAFIILLL